MIQPRENAGRAKNRDDVLGVLSVFSRLTVWRIFAMFAVALPNFALAAESLIVGSGTAQPAAAVSIPIALQSQGNVVSLQADVRFDANVFTFGALTADAAATNHTVASSEPTPGVRRLLLYSLNNAALGDGALAHLQFLVRSNAPEGTFTLSLSNVILVDALALPVLPLTLTDGAITVVQETNCTYTLSANHGAFTTAAVGNVEVIAAESCAWSVVNTNNWITITSGSSGVGNGTVTYSVAKNTKRKTRTGTLLIAGQPYLVIQSDTARPTVALISPDKKTKVFTNANVTLLGTANDNVGVARVEYSLNSKTNYQMASGTTDWSAGITLSTGKNTVQVRSIDLAGNVSAVVKRSYRYEPSAAFAPALAVSSGAMVQMPDHRFRFGFQVIPGSNYILQTSTDLRNWSNISTHRATTATLEFTETVESNSPQRFFRLRAVP